MSSPTFNLARSSSVADSVTGIVQAEPLANRI
jgi:hypothetical protein